MGSVILPETERDLPMGSATVVTCFQKLLGKRAGYESSIKEYLVNVTLQASWQRECVTLVQQSYHYTTLVKCMQYKST